MLSWQVTSPLRGQHYLCILLTVLSASGCRNMASTSKGLASNIFSWLLFQIWIRILQTKGPAISTSRWGLAGFPSCHRETSGKALSASCMESQEIWIPRVGAEKYALLRPFPPCRPPPQMGLGCRMETMVSSRETSPRVLPLNAWSSGSHRFSLSQNFLPVQEEFTAQILSIWLMTDHQRQQPQNFQTSGDSSHAHAVWGFHFFFSSPPSPRPGNDTSVLWAEPEGWVWVFPIIEMFGIETQHIWLLDCSSQFASGVLAP